MIDDANFTYVVGKSEASVWPGRCALHKVMCLDPEIVFVHTYMYNNTHTHTHMQRECHMMVYHGTRR